jgi:hypothetical protein
MVFGEGTGGDLLGEPEQQELSLPSQWWSCPSKLMGPLVPQLGACRNTLWGEQVVFAL